MKEHSGKIRNPILQPGAICAERATGEATEVRK